MNTTIIHPYSTCPYNGHIHQESITKRSKQWNTGSYEGLPDKSFIRASEIRERNAESAGSGELRPSLELFDVDCLKPFWVSDLIILTFPDANLVPK